MTTRLIQQSPDRPDQTGGTEPMTRESSSWEGSLNDTSRAVAGVDEGAPRGGDSAGTRPCPVTLPIKGRAANPSQFRDVATGAAHDMAALLLAIDSNLDLLSAEWLSKDGTDSV